MTTTVVIPEHIRNVVLQLADLDATERAEAVRAADKLAALWAGPEVEDMWEATYWEATGRFDREAAIARYQDEEGDANDDGDEPKFWREPYDPRPHAELQEQVDWLESRGDADYDPADWVGDDEGPYE